MSLDRMYKAGRLTADFVEQYFEALDCSKSLAAYLLWKHNEHQQLVDLKFDPHQYNDVCSARNSLAAVSFLSKANFLDLAVNREQVALEKFVEAEEVCCLTNSRFLNGTFISAETSSILEIMKETVREILGDVPTVDQFVDGCDWGPGATTAIKRRDANQPIKYESETDITSDAYDFVVPWFSMAFPNWAPSFRIRNTSKVVTVPKNAKTDRTIAIEPGLNLWFQKSIGTAVRRRLRRYGITLNDQSHNQRLSRLASKFNDLATVDFSAASDTIAYHLVGEILPSKWFALVSSFRVSSCIVPHSGLRHLEKFSSMGNGFTFELESLIFYSAAKAVMSYYGIKGKCSVYGDDVILPGTAYERYKTFCEDLGFSINNKKSYHSSYYRESCGAHYWNGVDIKPIFLKEPLDGKAAVLKTANNLRRSAHRRNSYGCDIAFLRCWRLLSDSLGINCPVISEGFGDLALVVDLHEARSLIEPNKNGIEGYSTRIWGTLPRTVEMTGHGVLLFKLRQIGVSELQTENNIPLACKTRVAKFRVSVPKWIDLGPWI